MIRCVLCYINYRCSNDRLSLHGKGSLYIENLRESDTGTYICRATNQEDSVDTVATLIVESKLELIS